MTDIVERLRSGTGDGLRAWDWMNEAADEIERLRQELADIKWHYNRRHKDANAWEQKATELRINYHDALEEIWQLKHERDEARAEVERLRGLVDRVDEKTARLAKAMGVNP